MAIIVNGNGPWTRDDGDRPGLYARFIQAAIAAIRVGARSKAATIKAIPAVSTGTAEAGKVYRITRLKEAEELFGADNVEDIRLLIIGGASEVVVSAFTEADVDTDYSTALNNLESYEFHVFVGPNGAGEGFTTDVATWLSETKSIGKNFVTVLADDNAEGSVNAVKANITEFVNDETVVYIANGTVKADLTIVKPELYAFYIAGTIAGAGLAEAITKKTVPFAEPSYRYSVIEIKDLLKAGALVTTVDGDEVQIEQGLTLGEKPYHKIRVVRAKQAMLDDIDRTVRRNYIGKITNSPDGQIAIINAVKKYLETLANGSVISDKFEVVLDPDYVSTGDELYLLISVRFLDSVEYVYLTTSVRLDDEGL